MDGLSFIVSCNKILFALNVSFTLYQNLEQIREIFVSFDRQNTSCLDALYCADMNSETLSLWWHYFLSIIVEVIYNFPGRPTVGANRTVLMSGTLLLLRTIICKLIEIACKLREKVKMYFIDCIHVYTSWLHNVYNIFACVHAVHHVLFFRFVLLLLFVLLFFVNFQMFSWKTVNNK